MHEFKLSDLPDIRKEIHSRPELSGEEYGTQKYLRNLLLSLNATSIKDVGKTGLLVEFKGENPGKSILFRGDMDALPIEESNEFEHVSQNEGVSHKCGHDGHTTIMLGVAKKLSEEPIKTGSVYILFQPSEENGQGAKLVLEDPNWEGLKIDCAFSVHNLPGFEKHQIVVKNGPFTASAESLIISIKGKTSHAAEPEKGRNPAYLIANILSKSEELTNSDTSSDDFFLFTPIYGKFGEKAYGTSAGKGEIHLTLRSWTTQVMKDKRTELVEFIDNLASEKGFKVKYKSLESFATNRNAEEAVEIIRQASKNLDLKVKEIAQPFKWGEDFGLFTQKYTGAMFGLGAGKETPALHNPDYDFPDELIETGVNMFYDIAKIASQK
jgi:amidohydrolase